jgi:hypothetical protein
MRDRQLKAAANDFLEVKDTEFGDVSGVESSVICCS